MRNPKTLGRAAKHQATRIDPPDILKLLDIAFGSLPRELKLWLFSVGTLRRRLHTLQSRFGLPAAGKPHFKLSSFRPGGATWMLAATEAVACLPKCGIFVDTNVLLRRSKWVLLSGFAWKMWRMSLTGFSSGKKPLSPGVVDLQCVTVFFKLVSFWLKTAGRAQEERLRCEFACTR